MVNPKDLIGRNIVSHNFRKTYSGHLDPEKLDAIVKSLLNAQFTKAADCNCYGAVFYGRIEFGIEGPTGLPRYAGNAGGLFSPGANRTEGWLFTDDIFRLYTTTASFSVNLTGAHDSLIFFDSSSNYLGDYQGIGAGSVVGVGGGTGNWIG